METFTLHQGTGALLISLPHDGSAIPDDIAARLTPTARNAPDTDWFVSRLYAFARQLGASILQPKYSRYVVDLNRPPDDVSLYPGQNTTGLCPSVQFTGEPVYLAGQQPGPEEIQTRVDAFWRPYHAALATELERLHGMHGKVLLWEGHSIRAEVPFLFEGRLPDINLGTAGGSSCKPATQRAIESVLKAQRQYTWVANGRFKGGYITRHYGKPDAGIEAVQLELAQCNYMDEDAVSYQAETAMDLQRVIEAMLRAATGA